MSIMGWKILMAIVFGLVFVIFFFGWKAIALGFAVLVGWLVIAAMSRDHRQDLEP